MRGAKKILRKGTDGFEYEWAEGKMSPWDYQNRPSRTIITSLTTLIALSCLFLFGGEVIKSFAFSMIIGVIIGTYSSIYVAVPTLLLFKFRPEEEE